VASEFGKPRSCNHGCGKQIYFDANSTVGHPSADKWIPLEYNGMKTDTKHECPNRQSGKLVTMDNANLVSSSATTVNAMDNLAVVKAVAEALNDYIAIKEGMATTAAAAAVTTVTH
jgi:hypothetical protein